MGFRSIIVGAAVASLALTGGAVTLGAGTSSAVTDTTVNDVRVGSFNLNGVNNDKNASGDHRVWRERRPVVVSQILAKKLDVVGLQEANQSTIYKANLDYGVNQYMDLVGALNAKGGTYAVTNDAMYNCVRPGSSQSCTYQDNGASNAIRIIYNTNRVTMVNQGSIQYANQTPNTTARFLVWAVLRMKATGREFFFSTTHLDPYQKSTRMAQWTELINRVNSLSGGRPVVVTGDFNTSKFDDYAATYLPAMKNAGYGDVLNQSYQSTTIANPRAETLTNAWVGSYNGWQRNIADYGYEDARTKIGNGIDWIFASNNLRVKQWGVTVTMDRQAALVKGVLPSDHAMVRATLVLP